MQSQSSKLYSCLLCNKSYTRRFSLNLHNERIHMKSGYTCEICKVQINRKRPHSCAVNNNVNKCYVCGLCFGSAKAMFHHRNTVHEKEISSSAVLPLSESNYNFDASGTATNPLLQNIQCDKNLLDNICLNEAPTNPILFELVLDENTVVYEENGLSLKCPLCFKIFNVYENFKDHIDQYNFLPLDDKENFFTDVSNIMILLTS